MRAVRPKSARGVSGQRDISRTPVNLTAQLQKLLTPANNGPERRKSPRVAIPVLIRVTPLDGLTGNPVGPTMTAVGKDLGKKGIGFFHQAALPHRLVRIAFDAPGVQDLSVEVELSWCRFSNLGWYESGGKLLRMIESDSLASLAG